MKDNSSSNIKANTKVFAYELTGARSRQVLNTLFSFHYNNNSTLGFRLSKHLYNKNLQII